ncbi:Type II secretion system protein E [Aquicella siphonis]|uniref:Type II secretion system protein E n=1 Tax=Aquicella siphonis TaxID=254247 RepID=A0A5E4PF63_9COXI|nr:type II secretion system ATPase GspE [Aquicella siphonis]VVC75067.1 Type II secretion system protein E [Aquicella siphonis]
MPVEINPLRFAFSKRYGVLVAGMENNIAKVVYHEKPPLMVLTEIRRQLQMPVEFSQVSSEEFNELLVKTYETDSSTAMQMAEDLGESLNLSDLMHELPKAEDLLEKQDDAPIIRLLNALLSEAIKEEASDVHIETFEDHVTIRFRVDGILREILEPPRILAPLIISRIKVMARLDIAEKRLPQDGRITLRIGGRAVDVRVSTMPTNHGERAVLRLLDKQTARLDLKELGMDPQSLELFVSLIKKPHGIILVTGPTGSGKTTTLYSGLIILNDRQRNILTVEDPIEFDLVGIGQTQVNNKINMTFAKGLRAILRQDPDVVMVGEIRDLETAQIAIQASLTGHLVLSTLHTNSAIGAITRLDDMGVEPFLLASSLAGVLAQRLMRLLCPECKKPMLATASECEILGVSAAASPVIYHAAGCSHCRYTGYSGRSGVYELIAVDETLRTMIHDRQPEQQMRKYARGKYPSLRQDGFRRVLNGETSLEEVLRVTSED